MEASRWDLEVCEAFAIEKKQQVERDQGGPSRFKGEPWLCNQEASKQASHFSLTRAYCTDQRDKTSFNE